MMFIFFQEGEGGRGKSNNSTLTKPLPPKSASSRSRHCINEITLMTGHYYRLSKYISAMQWTNYLQSKKVC